MGSATSLRDAIQRSVSAGLDMPRSDRRWMLLSIEFWAQATRDGFAREIVAGSFQQCRDLTARLLRTAQSAGIVRPDLDVEAASALLMAVLDGAAVQWVIDSEAVDLQRLEAAAVDLIERLITTDGTAGGGNLQQSSAGLAAEPRADDA